MKISLNRADDWTRKQRKLWSAKKHTLAQVMQKQNIFKTYTRWQNCETSLCRDSIDHTHIHTKWYICNFGYSTIDWATQAMENSNSCPMKRIRLNWHEWLKLVCESSDWNEWNHVEKKKQFILDTMWAREYSSSSRKMSIIAETFSNLFLLKKKNQAYEIPTPFLKDARKIK